MPARQTDRHQAAYEYWHAHGRSSRKTADHVGVSDRHILRWAEEFGWHEKADRRDAEAARIAEREAIEARAKMLTEHRQAAQLVRKRGVEFFAANKIDRANDALAAIAKGIELERTADNLPAALLGLLTMSEDELKRERERIVRAQAIGPDRPAALGEGSEPDEEDDPGREAGDPVLPAHPDGAATDVP